MELRRHLNQVHEVFLVQRQALDDNTYLETFTSPTLNLNSLG